jgi:hypothetical protein
MQRALAAKLDAECVAQVVLKPDTRALRKALAGYLEAERRLEAIVQCPSVWPPSQAPDEEGTRCDLIEGHEPDDPDQDGMVHRHRVKPTQCVVRWR